MLYILAVALFSAQSQPAAKADTKTDQKAPVTLNGCVTRDYTDARNPTAYTFIDNTDGSRYHIKGKTVAKYSGMSVQVFGTIVESKKLAVAGGLWPSPNVAAQAGAIDPATAGIAALPGGPTTGVGNVDIPTLNVTRLSLGSGECRK